MRIIAGKYRGKVLFSPQTTKVRPTADMVKQALFTKLQFFVQDKTVLDLFSGSGALGIEAISRGAKNVVFVDKDRDSILLTRKNLNHIGETATILHRDYRSALESFNAKFDLIIVDPPYASGVYDECLKIIREKNLLADDGIIVCEHDIKEKISDIYFEIFDEKRYGTVYLTYMQKK